MARGKNAGRKVKKMDEQKYFDLLQLWLSGETSLTMGDIARELDLSLRTLSERAEMTLRGIDLPDEMFYAKDEEGYRIEDD